MRPFLVAAAVLLLALPVSAQARSEEVGRSAQGRAITAVRVGNPAAPRKVLVVGAIHGNEQAGMAVSRRLRGARPPRGTELWLIDAVNPDGVRAHRRQNACAPRGQPQASHVPRGAGLKRRQETEWRLTSTE